MSPTPWHWLVLGGVLLLVEALAPGFVFFWLGISAGLTALLLWLLPGLAWQGQILAFALLTVASLGGWLWLRRRLPRHEAEPLLNRRAQQYVGSEAVLTAPITAGHGRVRIADATWLATGPELAAGTRVRIVGARGAVLVVAPLEAAGPDAPAPTQ